MAHVQHTNVVSSWKPVPGYEAVYEVSDYGAVRSVSRVAGLVRPRRLIGRVLKGAVDSKGYPRVALARHGTVKYIPIHTIVLLAFVGPKPHGYECCHCNGVKTDNRLANLRWDTPASNHRDKFAHGRLRVAASGQFAATIE